MSGHIACVRVWFGARDVFCSDVVVLVYAILFSCIALVVCCSVFFFPMVPFFPYIVALFGIQDPHPFTFPVSTCFFCLSCRGLMVICYLRASVFS